ncbi:hypothetical protein DSL72_007311 [Monilinia vaccinii-corymbosi]|uniref:Aminoglycoside phosphotransferase domain-containing protein n=1 Tax=Monilinia vaccinii-corymbosi TaxID=61207 RepID=A0A8A3PMX7_9HELO|nr:hypothetical protein DSL72_007311 [Monilinia vaccinii-corymbosi]
MDASTCNCICTKWRMEVELEIRHDESSYIAVLKGGDKKLLLKLTIYGDPGNEVRMMRFVPSSVPVPLIHDYGTEENGTSFLLMDYVEDSIPMCDFEGEPPFHLLKQMEKYVDTIRSVSLGYEHGICQEYYLRICRFNSTEYASASEFMHKRMQGVGLPYDTSLKFTDDRLDASKILSIIDWETAGYFPSFYAHSMYLFSSRNRGIQDDIFVKRWMKMFETPDTHRLRVYEDRIYATLWARCNTVRRERGDQPFKPGEETDREGEFKGGDQTEDSGTSKSREGSKKDKDKPESSPETNSHASASFGALRSGIQYVVIIPMMVLCWIVWVIEAIVFRSFDDFKYLIRAWLDVEPDADNNLEEGPSGPNTLPPGTTSGLPAATGSVVLFRATTTEEDPSPPPPYDATPNDAMSSPPL